MRGSVQVYPRQDPGSGGPERTPECHQVIIHGRRRRATDPEIPEEAVAVLRRELMSAHREVGAPRSRRAIPRPNDPRVVESSGPRSPSESAAPLVGADPSTAAGPMGGPGEFPGDPAR